ASGLLPTPAGLYVMYPSIAVNPAGDIVVGFSGANSTTFGSAYAIAGHFDGTNVTWGTAIQTQAGSAANTTGRFGDYSATTLDPADPGVFWSTQEFVPSSNAWQTRTAEVIPTVAGEVRWKAA